MIILVVMISAVSGFLTVAYGYKDALKENQISSHVEDGQFIVTNKMNQKTIDEIQKRGFKNVEVSLQSQQIRDLMDKLREIGAYGVGMSSFGPTVYSVFDKNNKHIVEEIKEYVGNRGIVLTTKAQNYGHEIQK